MSLIEFFQQNAIEFTAFHHPAAYTVADLDSFKLDWHGVGTKNLFLRNDKGDRHFLLVVPKDKAVDLKTLGKQTGLGRVGFASPERLLQHLNITPGAVSFLAVFNDAAGAVQVLLDEELRSADALHAHPLVNTQTWVIPLPDVERFLALVNHPLQYLAVPARPVSE
ncbi:MAG TPA: prolyl-tRNA synthetase associated domain-containing protein [Anaerolineales bacterium]|nr:prolyl-tRNA synthetase associated domain-containing protein [Anaerolineales bacterium]